MTARTDVSSGGSSPAAPLIAAASLPEAPGWVGGSTMRGWRPPSRVANPLVDLTVALGIGLAM